MDGRSQRRLHGQSGRLQSNSCLLYDAHLEVHVIQRCNLVDDQGHSTGLDPKVGTLLSNFLQNDDCE